MNDTRTEDLRTAIEALTNALRPLGLSAWLDDPRYWIEDASRRGLKLDTLLEQVHQAQKKLSLLSTELERILGRSPRSIH